MNLKFNKTTGIILGVALAVIIWITGILIGQEQAISTLNPEGGLREFFNQSKVIRTSLMIDYGDGRVEVYPAVKISYGGSVWKLLKSAAATEKDKLNLKYQEDSKSGEISNLNINGYSANTGGQQWLLWLNNNLQDNDLSKIRLKSRDVVELKYIKLKK